MLTNIMLGIGLSMDSVAVLLSLHAIDKRRKSLIHYTLPLMFAAAHMIMPIVGWAIGVGLRRFIMTYSAWIAFFLLFFVGGHMVYTAKSDTVKKEKIAELVNFKSLLAITFATSIDAVIVGMTFAFLNQSILFASLVIGLTTLSTTLLADVLGDHLGRFFNDRKYAVFGGIVIMGIGCKILIEHLFF
ncbi:MAG: manganese efflux pump [Patescibacteria group bacterium]